MIDVPKNIFNYGWGKCYDFRRVLQILWDYWISEKDEEYVYIEMHFRHKNGMEQEKVIQWINPNVENSDKYNKPPKVWDANELIDYENEIEAVKKKYGVSREW